jgi:hypothetical protein
MKNVLVTVLLLLGTRSFAQVGVVTIEKKDDPYLNMWFRVDHKDYEHCIHFISEPDRVKSKLVEILEPYDLNTEDFETDEEGDKFWAIEDDNGFTSLIYLMDIKNGLQEIMIQVLP